MEFTKNQLEAINELSMNLQIIACAGSGKTEVITQRIANIVLNNKVKTNEIVAFTFTNLAAAELKQRISKLLEKENISCDDMFVGTIHSFCWKYLSELPEFNDFSILDDVKEYLFIKRYGQNNGMNILNLSGRNGINAFKNCIDKIIIELNNDGFIKNEAIEAFNKYRDCLYKHKKITFPLIIHEYINRIVKNDILSATKYLVVDEYQDVDDIQEKIINQFYTNDTNICVVGDDDQTIYQFRGSNSNNMIGFESRYGNVRRIDLDTNFRSNSNIVNLASYIINMNQNRIKKEIKANTLYKGSIENCNNDIMSIIKQIVRYGYDYSDIAILVRNNKSATNITNILNENYIPNNSNNSEYILKSNSFNMLKSFINCLNSVDFATITSVFDSKCDETLLRKAFNNLRQERRSKKSIRVIFDNFLDSINFIKDNNFDYAYDVFTRIVDDFEEVYGDFEFSIKISSLNDFIDNEAVDLYKYHNFDIPKKDNAITVLTMHKAKGLQFKNVIIADMNNNVIPMISHRGINIYKLISNDDDKLKKKYESNIEDERRLFYVAITRAQDNLYITYDDDKKLSIFMEEIYDSNYLTSGEEILYYDLYGSSDNNNKKDDEEKEHFEWWLRYGRRRY